MSENGNLSNDGLDALRKRFEAHSRKAQAYYTVMHQMKGVLGSDAAASAWMNEALPPFADKTPAALVNEGREDEVLAYVSALKA